MRIELVCSCGASGKWESGTYVNKGGGADNKGMIYHVERLAAAFLKVHKLCLQCEVEE